MYLSQGPKAARIQCIHRKKLTNCVAKRNRVRSNAKALCFKSFFFFFFFLSIYLFVEEIAEEVREQFDK
jgi:hypothetical protein